MISVPSCYDGATRIPDRARLSSLHASDEQKHMERRFPVRWRLLVDHSQLALVRPCSVYRRSTIEAMTLDGLLCKCPNIRDAWVLTGWGLMVREAGIYTREEAT